MRRIGIMAMAALLAGCAAPVAPAPSAQADVEAIMLGMARADATFCLRRGFAFGTPEFGACYEAIQRGESPSTTARR